MIPNRRARLRQRHGTANPERSVMRYWDEFWNKYGFSDGSAIPPDAEVLRGVHITVVNARAAKLGSNFRLVPYNRPGLHNGVMIVSASVAYHDHLTILERLRVTDRYPYDPGEQGEDEQMREAIDWAMEQDLDWLVKTKVTVDRSGLRQFLKAAGPAPTNRTASRI